MSNVLTYKTTHNKGMTIDEIIEEIQPRATSDIAVFAAAIQVAHIKNEILKRHDSKIFTDNEIAIYEADSSIDFLYWDLKRWEGRLKTLMSKEGEAE